MRKRFRQLAAVIMLVAIAVSALSIECFAATLKSKKQYKTYTVIGDSVASGYGLSDDDVNPATVSNLINLRGGARVPGSYPDLVAKAVNCKTLYNEAREGYSAGTFLRMIDPEYEEYVSRPENYLERFYSECGYFMEKVYHYEDLQQQKKTIVNHIKAADIITVNLGSNDVGQYGMMAPVFKTLYYSFGMAYQPALTALQGKFQPITSLDQFFRMVGHYDVPMTEVNNAKAMFLRNYDRLIKRIRELNPKADIYVIGVFDSFKDDEPQDMQVRQAIQKMDDQLVADFKEYATKQSPYRKTIKYVDVPDVEYYSYQQFFSPEYFLKFLVSVHPTHAGHSYIANQIITRINGKNPATRINTESYRQLDKRDGTWGVWKTNGDLYTSFTGVAVRSGRYYYVKNGIWQGSYTGRITVATGSYQVTKGRVKV